jgi:ADP-ribosyl-[dinitrogen reductase] hydrolase
MNKLRDKKLGILVGLAVGDDMGAPYEFLAKGRYTPTKEYNTGGVHNVSIGEWTDDTSMALCLAQSLIERKCFDPID